ncbi:hypothetical protein NDU88_001148 [Pleurodeles waltl]|uniref:Uncharacterized protein n=1 Tax=Pleurodeles waltl TaxID=8319 RepID=A0AAV7P2X5_PLEWA|nr:hypothetical protein NDU88_001148 [Pleurodeles waltl]
MGKEAPSYLIHFPFTCRKVAAVGIDRGPGRCAAALEFTEEPRRSRCGALAAGTVSVPNGTGTEFRIAMPDLPDMPDFSMASTMSRHILLLLLGTLNSPQCRLDFGGSIIGRGYPEGDPYA